LIFLPSSSTFCGGGRALSGGLGARQPRTPPGADAGASAHLDLKIDADRREDVLVEVVVGVAHNERGLAHHRVADRHQLRGMGGQVSAVLGGVAARGVRCVMAVRNSEAWVVAWSAAFVRSATDDKLANPPTVASCASSVFE
jgi:hypothetical protein